MPILDHLMSSTAKPPPLSSVEQWWAGHQELASRYAEPAELALAGGFAADRLGFAFGSGYQAASAALFGPALSNARGAAKGDANEAAAAKGDAGEPTQPTALCATEGGSAHPRAIKTMLRRDGDSWRLSGHKSFVTFGTFARRLLVVASTGMHEGKNRLRLACITPRDGVEINAMPPAPFVPEIPHATLTLQDVIVRDEELLPGDGYADYLKPFRTVEDLHVHAALIGWLLQIARRHQWPRLCERLLASGAAILTLCRADPKSPATHIALGGAMATIRVVLAELDERWSESGDGAYGLWTRDRKLLKVAGSARAKRLQAAWRVTA